MSLETEKSFNFGDFRVDARSRVLFKAEKRVDLTPKAFEILLFLVENRDRVVSKADLLAAIWPDSFVEEANLSHHIFKLRRALGEDDDYKLIETVPKRGYRFIGNLEPVRNEPNDGKSRLTAASPRAASRKGFIIASALALVALSGLTAYLILTANRRSFPISAPQSSNVSKRSIAVLPFVNESGDESIEYLADGMTESLIGRLSVISSMRVRPRSAAFRFKGSDMAPDQIGRALSVETLLSGRLTKYSDGIRLFLSLTDVGTGYQIWGKQYDRKLSDLALFQSEVVKDVVEYLPVVASRPDHGNPRTTGNSEAYILYLKGRFQLNRKTDDGLKKALQHFNESVGKDPLFALAHAGIADAYNQMGLWAAYPPKDVFPKARIAAERALDLDPNLAEARTSLAIEKFYYEWDFAGAEADFKQAISGNPNYAFSRESYAIMMYETEPSRITEAIDELEIASEIDPLSLSVYFWRGAFQYFEGNYDLALQELKESQSIDPNYSLGLALTGAIYREKGMTAEYVEHWLRASSLEGAGLTAAESKRLRTIFASQGLKPYEVAYAELLQEKAKTRYVSPVFVAMHYSIAGENERALSWLEKAFTEKASWLVELKVDPVWKNLRNETRFQDLVRGIGFPEKQ